MKLYRFKLDCGRMGDLDGVFTATDEALDKLQGRTVYFGEVLGKHSEIYVENFDKATLSILSEETDFVETYERVVGTVGFNPLDYFDEDEDEDE